MRTKTMLTLNLWLSKFNILLTLPAFTLLTLLVDSSGEIEESTLTWSPKNKDDVLSFYTGSGFELKHIVIFSQTNYSTQNTSMGDNEFVYNG
eukprot:Pgem_evm1s12666